MQLFLSDIPTLLLWYLAISLIGLLFFPLVSRLFRVFPDYGYGLSKIVGIAFLGYTVWLLASLHILPFSSLSIWIAIGIWTIVNIFIFHRNIAKSYKLTAKSFLWFLVFEELLFLSMFLLWAWVRGHDPSLNSLEKYMDYGFMNSILKTEYFPPQDMWLSPSTLANDPYKGGFFINYYYFGHYITAFLTRLTGIASEVTYNLMLSTIFAFSWVASFSIGFALIRKSFEKIRTGSAVLGALLTAFLVTLAGNLHTIYIFTKGYENEHPVPFWQIFQFTWNPSYWYPNATRFIPNTIHEFPSYSWVVADLHGHVLDIPFVLLTLAVLLHMFLKSQTPSNNNQINSKHQSSNSKQNRFEFLNLKFIWNLDFGIWNLILLGFLSALMYMTNAWDGLIYLGLSFLVIIISQLILPREHTSLISNFKFLISKQFPKLKKRLGQLEIRSMRNLWVMLVVLLVSFVLFSLPFNLHFKPFVSGFGVVGGWETVHALNIQELFPFQKMADGSVSETVRTFGPFLLEKGNNERSPLWMMAVLWGFFYFFATIFLVYFVRTVRTNTSQYQILHTKYWKEVLTRTNPINLFLLLLIAISTMLLIFPEFFYAKDIYPGHYRANTMFKLGYQAYIMLSLVSGFTFVLVSHTLANKSRKPLLLRLAKWIGVVLVLLVGIYPYFGIQSYYGVWAPVSRAYEGQDGIEWLKTQYPGDYDVVQWLRQQPTAKSQQPTAILEAVGDSYTNYARISAYTGLPTPVGWPVHEWLWRGSYDEPGKRVEEIKLAYEVPVDSEPTALTDVLKKYDIRYIVVGQLERDKYLSLNEDAIKAVSTPVFASGETTVYEVK